MAVTENLHTGNGSKTNYAFTFPYLKTTDIKVSVDSTVVTNFTAGSPTATEIQFNTAPANNAAIRIYRDTATENLSATFYAGSSIKSEDLNDNFLQNLYVTQEAKRDADAAWQDGDETIISTETWASNNNRVATTGAIDGRIDAKVDTALTTDVSGGDGVTIVDNSPGSGQIRVDLDADIATLKDMQSGAATQLAALTSTELGILDGATVTTAELNLLDGVTATTAELNYVDGVTSSIQTQLDAKQSSDAELTELATMGSTTASALADLTQAEVQILDGATVTTAELNILDGVTATAAELNKTDGLTASTTELNLLDGVTATTAELNKLDGVTATTDELNKTDGLLATPTELNTLDGITSNTSELNKLDGVTASTTELNIVAGKSFKTSSGTLDTTSDTEIPSSKVIAAHVASSQSALGGFTTIADEVSFPNTQPATGVVVSINNAAGVVINGSGVSTSGKRVDNTTVTINGFPSSLNGETLAAGVGLIVVSTSTANTYNYHKILTSETDVKQLSDDINDFNSRYRIASSAPSSNNDEGDLYFDTNANKMKVYNGSSWDDVASVGNFYINTLSSTGSGSDDPPGGSATFNGTAKKFGLSNAPTMAQQLIVSINGVIQKPNAGTSVPSEGFAISGNDIIFSTAPAAGSDYFIVTQGSSVSIGTPSDNTVTSAKIVDGSILDGDISSTANIAGSKINDDSIPEVKLDVHNAPATDKYLKYTSNGMEWADGASEGTDVKSTGESGTTKFLRTDGDGTCSWQVPPDTQLTLVDEDNMASNSATSVPSQQSVKAYVDALSTAPTTTLVADGAIGANKPVIIKSNGKTAAVTDTINATDPVSTTGIAEYLVNATAKAQGHRLIYDPYSGVYAYAGRHTGTNYMNVFRGKNIAKNTSPSNGVGGTWDELAFTGSGTGYIGATNDMGPDPANIVITSNNGWIAWLVKDNDGDGKTWVVIAKTTSGNDSLLEGGHADCCHQVGTVADTRNTASASLVYCGDNQLAVIYADDSDGNKGYIRVGTVSNVQSSSSTLTWGTATAISTGYLHPNAVACDTANKKIMLLGRGGAASGNDTVVNSVVITVDTDNSVSVGTWVTGIQTANFNGPSMIFDTNTNRFVCAYWHDDSDYDGQFRVGSISGTTPSWGSEVEFHDDNIKHIALCYHPDIKKVMVAWSDDDSERIRVKLATISDSSNTITVSSNYKEIKYASGSKLTDTNLVYDTEFNTPVVGYTLSNTSMYVQAFDAGETTTNATASNFIGFSDAAYSDGANATIQVTGNANTGQSGMTVGTKQYVQLNGSLSTTVTDVPAGISLSATKLLIKA